MIRSVVLAATLLAAYAAARVFDRALTFELRPKVRPASRPLPDSLRRPLPLRLVDAGGVGIVADTSLWRGGENYSHATGAFHHVMLSDSPYIAEPVFSVVRRDWRAYLRRMAEFGSNGVVVPGVLPFIDFDRAPSGAVYGLTDPARRRHAAYRAAFAGLFRDAEHAGMRVYLATDMLTLTPTLERYLERRVGSLDAERADLWEVYAAGFDELFDALPQVQGIVIRVGEGGALFNAPGWEYRSQFAVRTTPALRTMLRTLLPVFERHGRTLILRTWSVGAGGGNELGDIHTNPDTYIAALRDIDSPSLIVSTKCVRGDFYGYTPVNPTLLVGRQRRLVEFQARREYEGFGAFPNYVAGLYQSDLRAILNSNPNVVGSWLWTQEGGPLHAGPMSLYPLHGSWGWIDANVYSVARLVRDPAADTAVLASEWARRVAPGDSGAARAVARVLLASREVVDRGLYVRPFAQRDLRALGVEAPPMLWILEWDIVGGSSAVWSTVYRGARDHLAEAIADGFTAARQARAMRDTLGHVIAGPSTMLRQLQHSLDYEVSLLETLAWYRQAMLEYYSWLDTWDTRARATWETSAERFAALAQDHEVRFRSDLDAPAYDFSVARLAMRRAGHGDAFRWTARAFLLFIIVLLLRPRWSSDALVVGLATVALALVSAGASSPLLIATACVCGATALALHQAWGDLPPDERREAQRLARVGSLVGLALLVAPVAWRGPGSFWLSFWTPGGVRLWLVTALLGITALTWFGIATVSRRALGGALLATAVCGIALSLVTPSLPVALAALERPLGLAPMGPSFIHGVIAYFDFPRAAPWYPAIAGLIIGCAGVALRGGIKPRGSAPAVAAAANLAAEG